MLRASDRFSSEIRRSLEAKGFEAKDIEATLDHLIRRKLVDDRRTTLNLIERRSGRRSVGTEKLRSELMGRGAPEEIVDECLAGLPHDRQRQAMLEALSSKFKPDGNRIKGARFLISRGFEEDEIEGALDEFFQND